MSERKPMICPKCGVAMNEHGEKLMDPIWPQSDLATTPDGGTMFAVFDV